HETDLALMGRAVMRRTGYEADAAMPQRLEVRCSLRGGLPVARYDHRRQIVEAYRRETHELTVDLQQGPCKSLVFRDGRQKNGPMELVPLDEAPHARNEVLAQAVA